MGYIYKIINSENNKVYIGQTRQDPEKRWKEHIKAIKSGQGCTALRNAIQKHGLEKFKMVVLIICFDEDRFAYERQYISKYNSLQPNGYNITPGGEGGGGFIGKKHSQEVKDRISQIVKDRFKNSEEYNKTRIGVKKYWCNLENRKKHSECMKNVIAAHNPKSEEHKKKLSESIKNHYKELSLEDKTIFKKNHSETMTKVNGRPINQYTLDGTFIKSHISILKAAESIGISRNSIAGVLSGKYKTAKGYLWKYVTLLTQ